MQLRNYFKTTENICAIHNFIVIANPSTSFSQLPRICIKYFDSSILYSRKFHL